MTIVALTPGEPAGIGPDLTLQLALVATVRMVVIADKPMLQQRAADLALDISIVDFATGENLSGLPTPCALEVIHVPTRNPVACGHLDPANSTYVLETLDRATQGCLSGEFDALVTGPIHKGVVNAANIPFTGHTEYLARLCDVSAPVMMCWPHPHCELPWRPPTYPSKRSLAR